LRIGEDTQLNMVERIMGMEDDLGEEGLDKEMMEEAGATWVITYLHVQFRRYTQLWESCQQVSSRGMMCKIKNNRMMLEIVLAPLHMVEGKVEEVVEVQELFNARGG